MASNSVQYIFEILDKYTPIIQRMSRLTKKFNNGIKKSGMQLKIMAKRFKEIGNAAGRLGKTLTTRLTLPIVALGGFMIKAASDAAEVSSKFETVFKDVPEKAAAVAESLRKNYGMSRMESKKLLGNTGDLLTGFGFTGDAALDLSKKVNELAADLASFNNLPTAQASAAVTKALLGERESIKTLGISILEEDVKKRLQILRMRGLTFASVRQAKAYATLQLATEQSKNAIGDFNRTQEQFANRLKILKARLSDLGISFGSPLLAPATKLITKLISLSERLERSDEMTKKMILGLAGIAAIIGPLLLAIKVITVAFAILSGPVGLTVLAIGAISAGIIFLIKNIKLVKEPFKDTFESITIGIIKLQRNISNLIDKLKNLWKSFSKIGSQSSFIKGFSAFKNLFSGTVNTTNESIINGNIGVTVAAAAGSSVRQVVTQSTTPGVHLGLNMSASVFGKRE